MFRIIIIIIIIIITTTTTPPPRGHSSCVSAARRSLLTSIHVPPLVQVDAALVRREVRADKADGCAPKVEADCNSALGGGGKKKEHTKATTVSRVRNAGKAKAIQEEFVKLSMYQRDERFIDRSFICSFVHSFIHLFIHSSICSFIHSLIHPPIRLLIYGSGSASFATLLGRKLPIPVATQEV